MFRKAARVSLLSIVALAVTVAQGQTPIANWATAETKLQLLPGVETTAKISPCLMFRATTNLSADVIPVQCTANPMYLLAQTYRWMKDTAANPHEEPKMQLWRNSTAVAAPKNFTATLARKALFRIAQKQHWCHQYTDKAKCTTDTRTPCTYIQDDRLTYSLGLNASNSSCVYYTQSSFFRVLIWEMYQLENHTSNPETLAGALNCLWPPYKRQAVECDSDKVDKFCAKLPPWCKPLVDTFRFSCQSSHALDDWRKSSQYTNDDFNATQNMYRSAMQRLYSATLPTDVYNSAWGDSYTSWFLYQFTGALKGMEAWMSNTTGMTHGSTYPSQFSRATVCSKFKTEAECVNPDLQDAAENETGAFADASYCSWSREQLIPGMSNADNPDYPRRRCQLSTKARLQAAVITDGTRGSPDSKDSGPTGYLKAESDLLTFLYDNLFHTDAKHRPGASEGTWCGDPLDCRVVPLDTDMVFPAWVPSQPRGSASDCEAALSEVWEV